MTPHIITVDNVNQALPEALWYRKTSGIKSESRNGPVIVAPGPVLTVYRKPWQRVLFSEKRDANPFFHFFEALWMLAGRDDVSYLAQFTPNIKTFSDGGVTLNGAYGYRWRTKWFDQIVTVVEHLKKNPESRREVLAMWEPWDLINENSKDLPCNTQIYVDIREGELNITVCNRSNDLWWGAYGANAVHMSFLHEFLARAVGVEIGTYIQMSNNFHIYTKLYDGGTLVESPYLVDFDAEYPGLHYSIVNTPYEDWLSEAGTFVEEGNEVNYLDPFFNEVASPMFSAWMLYKANDLEGALNSARSIAAMDWRKACTEWIIRRITKRGERK